ncbi:hypothetical protein QCA50_007917 [Cerrena zonata]|uniref:Uncharacterized protein n=1 Tax=Cerrena zonata TaxID=2478898 RepID=A0AAW0G7E1_9APHY
MSIPEIKLSGNGLLNQLSICDPFYCTVCIAACDVSTLRYPTLRLALPVWYYETSYRSLVDYLSLMILLSVPTVTDLYTYSLLVSIEFLDVCSLHDATILTDQLGSSPRNCKNLIPQCHSTRVTEVGRPRSSFTRKVQPD